MTAEEKIVYGLFGGKVTAKAGRYAGSMKRPRGNWKNIGQVRVRRCAAAGFGGGDGGAFFFFFARRKRGRPRGKKTGKKHTGVTPRNFSKRRQGQCWVDHGHILFLLSMLSAAGPPEDAAVETGSVGPDGFLRYQKAGPGKNGLGGTSRGLLGGLLKN